MAALFRLGQVAGAKAKVQYPTGATAKAITSRREPETSSGAFRVTYTSLRKSRFQLAGQNAEQFLQSQRASLKSCYLAWNNTAWLTCANTTLAVKSSPPGKYCNRVVVSLTDFNKHFNAPMLVFIRNFFVLQTVKFKASLVQGCVIRVRDRQFSCSGSSNHSELLCHQVIFPLKKQEIWAGTMTSCCLWWEEQLLLTDVWCELCWDTGESTLVIPLQTGDLRV